MIEKSTELSYQIDAMGDLGDAVRKISNGEYSEAIFFIEVSLETIKSIFNKVMDDQNE